MLVFAGSIGQLSFSKLMAVYQDSNREHGAEFFPEETEERQAELSEQDFYQFLREDFFTRPGVCYAVWQEGDEYISALRLEPFRDGLLLEGLETSPSFRNRGYACELIRAVQASLERQGSVTVYSHVNKRNTASLRVHKKCGFSVLMDYSVYIDGSVNNRACTLIYKK